MFVVWCISYTCIAGARGVVDSWGSSCEGMEDAGAAVAYTKNLYDCPDVNKNYTDVGEGYLTLS